MKKLTGPVTVIGGANVDINCFSKNPIIMADSNPGKIEYCPGGVGRNIAENLTRLMISVHFIGVFGDDPGGELIKKSCTSIGLDIKHSMFVSGPENVTSVYAALTDSDGTMRAAIADMDIMELMTTEHLESKADIIKESSIILLDTNLPYNIIDFLLERFGGSGSTPFYLDAVSAKKAARAAFRIGSFDTIKLGRMEAAVISGVDPAKIQKNPNEAASRLIDKGVRRVFITLGKDGTYYADRMNSFFIPVQYSRPVNTSGAGDAFMAGIVFGTLQGWDEITIIKYSIAMAQITLQSRSAVNPAMCRELADKYAAKLAGKNE
ncbi:MAG: carbohydrate kinase family protein [Treponema sp.]|nr:carbohydrate kinase family protein [Treponema sp.]